MGRTLLQKYDIPISHLDFEYVKKCKSGKEMEKIVRILRSGEEGCYPDLTKCAEDKLKELMPNSQLFRFEEQLLTKDNLNKNEWETEMKPLNDWSEQIKLSDNFLSTLSTDKKSTDDLMPPIRYTQTQKIDLNSYKKSEKTNTTQTNQLQGNNSNKQIERIKSTDYSKWDKFDADTEILKMDLDEERKIENVEIQQNKNKMESIANTTKTIPLHQTEIYQKLTNIEKEKLSLSYKDCGNDYFKVKDYDAALIEYNKCIEMFPSANGYNNRAIAYLKLLKYKECINDCDECLKIDSVNIKALLRKAQAYLAQAKKREAFHVYNKILSIEPSNVVARKSLNDLKSELPPENATRLQIQNEDSSKNVTVSTDVASSSSKKSKNCLNIKKTDDNYEQEDLSKLIMPKKIIKNNFTKTLEALNPSAAATKSNNHQSKANNDAKDSQIQYHPKYLNAANHQSPIMNKLKLLPDIDENNTKFGVKTNPKKQTPLIQEIP